MHAHHWTPYPEGGDGEEICECCGARPGTLEAEASCDEPDPAGSEEQPPEPWVFWPGDHYDDMSGFDRPPPAEKPPA